MVTGTSQTESSCLCQCCQLGRPLVDRCAGLQGQALLHIQKASLAIMAAGGQQGKVGRAAAEAD